MTLLCISEPAYYALASLCYYINFLVICIIASIDYIQKYKYFFSASIIISSFPCYIYYKLHHIINKKRKEVEILQKSTNNSIAEIKSLENINKKLLKERDEMEMALRESSEFIFLWKWKDDKNQWIPYDHKINKRINKLSLNESRTCLTEKNYYSVRRTSKKCGFQTDLQTKKKREIKRDIQSIDAYALLEEKEHLLEKTEHLLEKTKHLLEKTEDIGYIVQWQWNDDSAKSEWISYPDEINKTLEELQIDTSFNYDCIQNNKQYKIHKVTKDTAIQINVQTKRERACRRYRKKIETLLKETEQKDTEYGDLQQKVGYEVLWEWYNASTQIWIQCAPEIYDGLEQLSVNEEAAYHGDDNYLYKFKRLTKDTAKQWIVNNNETTGPGSLRSLRRIEKASGFNQIEYPGWWHHTFSIGYTVPNLVSLSCYTGFEKVVITELFNETAGSEFKILNIGGVKNEMLWDKYQNEKKSLIKAIGAENINERYLFHGSQTKSTLRNILTQGFRPEFNNILQKTYGKGVYFTKDAIYSTGLAANDSIDTYKMLCCKVMTGESTKGKKKYHLANWPKKSNGQIFDSLVNSLLNPSIFAIHESCRAYPLYVIRYKKK